MDYQKMLFAAEVHRLAIELHEEAKEVFLQQSGTTGEDRRIAAMHWEGENKITMFVPRAVTAIAVIAEQIDPTEEQSTDLNKRWP